MPIHSVVALGIFLIVYAIILAGHRSPRKLDRPAAGLMGGVLMVLCGVLTRAQALAAIDFATLALLFGMMVIIHYAIASGLLDNLARRLVAHSRGPFHLLWLVCLASGGLSALFVNDTICLLMTPLILTVTRHKRLPAEPYLLALATGSNVGSMMTLTGNPQNMLIGQSSGWTWGALALRMVPIGLLCLLLNGVVLTLLFRKALTVVPLEDEEDLAVSRPLDHRLAFKTVLVLLGLMIAFLCGAPMDLSALTAAVVMLVLANRPPEETFADVDWTLLLFFAGLFVVVAGITKVGGSQLARLSHLFHGAGASLGELATFALMTVIGSNLFSNVPLVMLLRGELMHAPHAPLLWLVLSAASTLAGNLTLVGSVANLIVAEGAKEECPLSFWSFLRVGIATTTLTVAASVLLLWLYSVLHWV